MANYTDTQGYKFKMPVNSIKKPLGTAEAVGTKKGTVYKLIQNNTNVVYFSPSYGISLQTTGITADPSAIIAQFQLPNLISGSHNVICILDDWNIRIEFSINGSKRRVDPADCDVSFVGLTDSSEVGHSKISADGNYVGSVSELIICIYDMQMTVVESGGVTSEKNVKLLGCFAHGDFLGFKGWFLVAGIGWIPDYYGIVPDLQIPEAVFDRTEYSGGSRGSNTNSTQGVPDLPNFSYANHGKKTYLLTSAQSDALHQFMWSNDFVDALVKMYAQPMQTIESMFVNDCYASGDTPANINLGNVNSGISATLTNSFVEVDCGSVFYNEEYGSYIDYEPYVSFQLYLPRIGVVPISAKDVVNNAIHILYQIDVVTGFGTCYVIITRTRDAYTDVLMQISAQMLTSIPYSGMDASARVNAAAQCVTNLVGGNLMGAGTNALNTLIAPCNVQKSPISSSLLLSQKKPMLMVTRTKAVLPETYGEDVGFMCMVSDKLNGKTGFFKIRDAHTPMVNNDEWISSEIDRLLEQGVYIK